MRLFPIAMLTGSALALMVAYSPNAHAQLAVFDAPNFANTLNSDLTEIDVLAQQIISAEQAVLQTEQMIKNAAGLANLSNLISALGLNPLLVTADQLRMVLSGAYAIDANSANFTNQIRQQLATNFTIPLQIGQITQIANSTYSSQNAATVLATYATKIRDFSTATQYQNVLNNAQTQGADIHQQVQTLLASAQTLGDGSETAALHSLAAQSGAGLRQADLALQYHQVIADKATQDELRRLEQEVALLEAGITATQANTAMRQAAFQSGQ